MSSRDYWERRAAELENAVQAMAGIMLKKIIRAYNAAFSNIDSELKRIFGAYSSLTGLDEKAAQEYISAAEKDKTVNELRRLLALARTDKERRDIQARIDAKAYGYRMTRLERLEEKIYCELKKAAASERAESADHYRETVKKAYYSTLDDIAYAGDIGISFSELPDKVVEDIVDYPWSGRLFSDRIWDNTDILAENVCDILAEGIAAGSGLFEMSEKLDELCGRGIYNAARLVRTESNYFNNRGTLREFEDADIDKYRFCATLDARTSKKCRRLDGRVFKTADAVQGKNYPPMHPWCRSVAVQASFEYEGKRAARDPETGKVYYVDRNTSYMEWYNGLTEHQRTLIDNYGSDRRQYERYREVLGAKNVPKTFDKFRRLKYNDSERYGLLTDYYSSRRGNMISAFTAFEDYIKYKARVDDELVGLTTADGVKIQGQSKHFIERVFGTSEDPHTGRPRDGVEIEDIKDALLNGEVIAKRTSTKYRTDKCEVSVNHETGNLIQTNPHRGVK